MSITAAKRQKCCRCGNYSHDASQFWLKKKTCSKFHIETDQKKERKANKKFSTENHVDNRRGVCFKALKLEFFNLRLEKPLVMLNVYTGENASPCKWKVDVKVGASCT